MKLHLPSSLRKALLACLAALVAPSVTLASASSLLGAALVSYLVSAPQVQALDLEAQNGTVSGRVETTDGLRGGELTIEGEGDDAEIVILGTDNNNTVQNVTFQDVKLVMSAASGWQTFVSSTFDDIEFLDNGEIVLEGGATVNGAITNTAGMGHLTINNAGNYVFEQNVSVGAFDVRNGTITLNGDLMADRAGLMVGDGNGASASIAAHGNVSLTVESGTSSFAGSLTMDAGYEFTKSGVGEQTLGTLTLTSGRVVVDAGTLSLSTLAIAKGSSDTAVEFVLGSGAKVQLTTLSIVGGYTGNDCREVIISSASGQTGGVVEYTFTGNQSQVDKDVIIREGATLRLNTNEWWTLSWGNMFVEEGGVLDLQTGELDIQNGENKTIPKGTIVVKNGGTVTSSAAEGTKAGKLTLQGSASALFEKGSTVTLQQIDVRSNSSVVSLGDLTVEKQGVVTNSGVGSLTIQGGSFTLNNTENATFAGSFSITDDEVVFTKKGAGKQTFSGEVSIYDALITGGELNLSSTNTDQVVKAAGSVTVNGGILTWSQRGSMYTWDTDWTTYASELEKFVHFEELNLLTSSAVEKNATIGTLTWGDDVEVYVHNANADRPFIAVDEKVVSTGGTLKVWGAYMLMEKGGALGGSLNLAWGGGLILGGDLDVSNLEVGTMEANNRSAIKRKDGVEDIVWVSRSVASSQGGTTGGQDILYYAFLGLYGLNNSSNYLDYGEGVGIRINNTKDTYWIRKSGANSNADFDIPVYISGKVCFGTTDAGVVFNFNKGVYGDGDLEVWTENFLKNGGNDTTTALVLHGGGLLTGHIRLNDWGARLTLDSDFEAGGLWTSDTIRADGQNERQHRIDSSGALDDDGLEKQFALTLNVAGSNAVSANVVDFRGNLLLRKTGSGTQTIKRVSFGEVGTDTIDVSVEDGRLVLGFADQNNKVFTGSLAILGDGELAFTDGSTLANATIGKDFHWDRNVAENLGSLTVGGTLHVGSLVPDEDSGDDAMVSRADTNTLTLYYNISGGWTDCKVNTVYLNDVIVDSGVLDIELEANGGSAMGSMTYYLGGSLSGEGEGAVLQLRRSSAAGSGNYTALLQLDPQAGDMEFAGTLAFADSRADSKGTAGYTYASAELSLGQGNAVIGALDTRDGSGAIGFTGGVDGAAQRVDVLREVTGTYSLRFGRSSSGVLYGTAGTPFANEAVYGEVNLHEGGAITRELYLGYYKYISSNTGQTKFWTDSIALNIGNGKTLSVGGLAGWGGGGIGIWNEDGSSEGSAVIEITGQNSVMRAMNIAEGITLRLRNDSSQFVSDLNGGLNSEISIIGGPLELGNNATMVFRSGTMTLKERVTQISEANGGAATDAGNVELRGVLLMNWEKGGDINGHLWVSNGTNLALGDDLSVGGLKLEGNISGGTIRSADSVEDNVLLVLNPGQNKTFSVTSSANNPSLAIGSATAAQNKIGVVKKNKGTQEFGIAVNLRGAGGLNIQEGRVSFTGGTSNVYNNVRLWGAGALRVTGTNTNLILNTYTLARPDDDYLGALEVMGGGQLTMHRDLTVHDLLVDGTRVREAGDGVEAVSRANTITNTTPSNTYTLTVDVADGTTAGNLNMATQDGYLELAQRVRLTKSGEGVFNLRGLVAADVVSVTEGTLELAGSWLKGNVSVDEGATLSWSEDGVLYDTTAANTTGAHQRVDGDLQGAGTLRLDAVDLELTKTGTHSFSGLLDMNNGGGLILHGNLEASGLVSSLGQDTTACQVQAEGQNVRLTLNVATGDPVVFTNGNWLLGTGVLLEKKGAGTQVLYNFGAEEQVTVSNGVLQLAVAGADALSARWDNTVTGTNTTAYFLREVVVDGASSVLDVAKSTWHAADKRTAGAGTRITLKNGGSFRSSTSLAGEAESLLELGTLALGATEATGAAGSLAWSTRTGSGSTENWHIYKLTGTGVLTLDAAATAVNGQYGTKLLDIHRIVDLNGSVNYTGAAWAGDSMLLVGSVDQALGMEGSITGIDAYSYEFRKSGLGSFSFDNTLHIGAYGEADAGVLYMNYTGSLSIGELSIEGGSVLKYTIEQDGSVITWDADKLVNEAGLVLVNVDDIIAKAVDQLSETAGGLDLGITGMAQYADATELLAYLELDGLDPTKTQYTLRWDENGHLRLIVTEYVNDELPWDGKWGLENMAAAVPGSGVMDQAAISKSTATTTAIFGHTTGEFNEAAAALGSGIFGEAARGLVKLDRGDTAADTRASIIGGWLIDEAAEVPTSTRQTRSVYILVDPSEGARADNALHYHLLVGGSSFVYHDTTIPATRRRFDGNTHIQMEGGVVDYIVGGNHVTNGAYSFEGNSFISVMGDAAVRGGIVGGSTITRGAAMNPDDPDKRAAIEFDGHSYIYLHSVLGGGAAGAPQITTGSAGAAHQSFAAVVGGNAWIELVEADTQLTSDPLFRGSSRIEIVLNDGTDGWESVKTGSFDKAIVGGNYTVAFDNAESDAQTRSTRFRQNGDMEYGAHIIIYATDGVTFTAGVNGGSRRASAGAGSTYFEADTMVELHGGKYTDMVAGGLWFDKSASGQHDSTLIGNTAVLLDGGEFWRAIGGSVMLGGANTTSAVTGDASVSITGGTFRNAAPSGAGGELLQTDIGLVAGGNLYRGTGAAGSENTPAHVRTGNTSVVITGGTFEDIHIVGGDYANFTDAVTNSYGPVLRGSSSVSITGEGVSITGLVVGGSYLTDEGTGGSVTIDASATKDQLATHVVIGDGAKVAHDSGTTGHSHSALAVVAGHVLMDELVAGNHSTVVKGNSLVEITGGEVDGVVVGGSFAGASAGQNSLALTGTSTIRITGGSVLGNVVGGHYSENTTHPDMLELHGVQITLSDEGNVQGDIIGGSHRETSAALTAGVEQGDITISLLGGQLAGNVYAAGEHTAQVVSGATPLQVTTNSTTVNLSSAVVFSGAGEQLISGGYRKSVLDAAQDISTVKKAELVFTDSGYENLSRVSLRDFTHVNNASDVVVGGSLSALDDASLTKLGAGRLTLMGGLVGSADGEDFTGRLVLQDGVLALGTDCELSRPSAIVYDMTDRRASTKENAWLQAAEGAMLLVDENHKANIQFTAQGDFELRKGTYYLTGELNGGQLGSLGVEELLTQVLDTAYFEGLGWLEANSTLKAKVVLRDACLVLQVYLDDPNAWIWKGGEDAADQVWQNNSNNGNWSRETGHHLTENDDVFFNSGAANGNVLVSGEVTPGDVWVESGDFTFSPEDADTTGIRMSADNVLRVGLGEVNGVVESASLDLQLDNVSIPKIQLNEGGTLTISSAGAIQVGGAAPSIIEFNGGTLAYGENEDGSLVINADLSGQVHDAHFSGSISRAEDALIRIQVGNSSGDTLLTREAAAGVAAAAEALRVTWGSAASGQPTEGVRRILSDGLVKSGRGALVVRWLADTNVNYSSNTICVTDGTAVFEATGALARPIVRFGSSQDASMAPIEVSGLGKAQFILTDNGSTGTLSMVRPFVGDGTVALGGTEEHNAYVLASDNSEFNGVIEFVGDSSEGFVQVARQRSLHASKLVLSGRGFSFLSDAEADLNEAGEMLIQAAVEVTADTVNYVGQPSENTTLWNAQIVFTGDLTGSGVMANSGTSAHRISGDISAFTGTLLARDAGSTWTLDGAVPDGGDVLAGYDGSGKVLVALTGDDTPRLRGLVSGHVSLENMMAGAFVLGNTGNTSDGALVFHDNEIRLGDAEVAGSWAGSVFEVAPGSNSGAFVLVNGALPRALDAAGIASGVTLSVQTARPTKSTGTTVDAGGTQGSLFHDITIDANGHLNNVSGVITAGDGTGGTTKVKLVLDANNIHTRAGKSGEFLIGMTPGGALDIGDGSQGFTLEFSTNALVEALKAMREADVNGSDGRAWLHLLNGGELRYTGLEDLLFNVTGESTILRLLADLGFKLDSAAAPGELVLTGSSKDVYLVLGEDDAKSDACRVTADNKAELESKLATVVASDATLDIYLDGADAADDRRSARVNNLVGVEGSTLHGHNASPESGEVTIELNNSRITKDKIDGAGVTGSAHGGLDSVEEVRGQDTAFDGVILGDEGVNFNKTGKGALTVGSYGDGGVQVAGDIILTEGALRIEGDQNGQGNEVGRLVFAYETPQDSANGERERGFTFRSSTTRVHGIAEEGSEAGDDVIRLEQQGKLIFDAEDDTTLSSTSFTGDGSGTLCVEGNGAAGGGKLTLQGDGSGDDTRLRQVQVEVVSSGELSLTGGAQMVDSSARVEDGSTLSLESGAGITGDSALDIAGELILSGASAVDSSGELQVRESGVVRLADDTSSLHARNGASVEGTLDLGSSKDNSISGLSGSGTLAGAGASLDVQGSGNTFSGTFSGTGSLHVGRESALVLDNVQADASGHWSVSNEGSLVMDVSGGRLSQLGDVSLGSGSDTTVRVNTDGSYTGRLAMDSFEWSDGAHLTIENAGKRTFYGDSLDLGRVENELSRSSGLDISLSGLPFLHYEAGEIYRDAESGHLMVGMNLLRDNPFRSSDMSKNELAGADLFWNASDPYSSNWQRISAAGAESGTSDLYNMVATLAGMLAADNRADMGKLLAAGAGASTSVLGAAFAQDVQRQLSAIRNRTINMAPEPHYDSYDTLPFYHAWISGESSYHKLGADGMAPGFTLSGWGGSVGVDANVSQQTTVGFALSAMYNDLKADAADSARGDLDTTYVTAFARMAQGAWLHTVVVTGGVADVKLNRTVNYGASSYTTHGSTDGYAFGALYEVGYAHVLSESGSAVLQPVFNVAFRHASLAGYSETGSDAGLKVDDISQDVITVGAGVRLQAMVGTNAFNRSAVLEGRVLVKGDAGDRSGTVMNRLINGDGTARELESAKIGAVGLEFGVGLMVPVGSEGDSIFIDASVEMRRGYTSFDANVGYRFNF